MPACDASGEPVSPFSPKAVRWDIDGAISCYTGLPLKQQELRLRATEAWTIWDQDNSKSECPCQRTLHDFNDTTTWPWIELALRQANL
jgi:hypothetical protein